METTPSLTNEIIQKAQEGDQEAFGEIFEALVAPIYRFSFFRVADNTNAEKLTEEVFLKIWKSLRKFRPHGKITFKVWAFQIAHSTVERFLERVKKMGDERKFFLAQQNHSSVSVEHHEQQKLADAFFELPTTQADAVIYKYFCDLPTIEIGLILEKTEGAVRILQSRGLKKLREGLGE
jgi:RNA polymerase sigma-70 factor (ECF subfamily)